MNKAVIPFNSISCSFNKLLLILLIATFFCNCNSPGNIEKNNDIRISEIQDQEYQEKISFNNSDDSFFLEEAIKEIESDSVSPKTIAMLSVLVNKYYNNPKSSEMRKNAIEALRHLANIHMSYDIDYRKAYKYISEARQLAEEDEDYYNLSFIYLSLVNLYYMNDNEKKDFQERIKELMQLGIETSLKSNNEIALVCFIVDYIELFGENESEWNEKENMEKTILNYNFKTNSPYTEFAKNLIKGINSFDNQNFTQAEYYYFKANENVGSIRFGERFLYIIKKLLMNLYKLTEQPDKEIAEGKELLVLAEKNGYKDFELSTTKALSEVYASRGLKDSAEFYHTKYLHLEEAMKRDNGYETVKTLDFVSEITRINEEVAQLSIKRQEQERRQVIFISALIILGIILMAIIWRYLNLRKNHKSLYRINQEMVKREEQHKLLRQQWNTEKNKTENISSDPLPVISEEERTDFKENEEKMQLTPLYAKILDKMESAEEIFRPGFSLNDMAGLLQISPRMVSRAINICHGTNFHQLLNEYRIREASKKMNDPKSQNLTIETIAESVGFKSRTSFAALFKKFIGITPSEYWKIAKSEK